MTLHARVEDRMRGGMSPHEATLVRQRDFVGYLLPLLWNKRVYSCPHRGPAHIHSLPGMVLCG